MKTTDKKALQEKSKEELQKQIKEAYNTLGQIRLDHAQNKLKNTRSIFLARKEIAVMQSFLQMKRETKEGEEK